MSKLPGNLELVQTTSFRIELHDGYVLTGHINARNNKISWWMTKVGYTKSTYCFSTFPYGVRMLSDLKPQLEAVESYIALFDKTCINN